MSEISEEPQPTDPTPSPEVEGAFEEIDE